MIRAHPMPLLSCDVLDGRSSSRPSVSYHALFGNPI
jgi:hypothetical protein